MKKILLSVLLLPALAFAQPVTVDKKVLCDKADTIISILVKQYGEEAIWLGDITDGKVVLLVNKETQSWSVVQFVDEFGCILEAGSGFQTKVESKKNKNII